MVQIYRKKWQRGFFSSLLGYIRDGIVLVLPIKRLPAFLIRILYGVDAQFAFFVHPRAYQDVFISAPFLKVLKFLFRRERAFQFVSTTAPFVLNSVRTRQGVDGLVLAQLTVPELLFEKRNETLEKLEKALRLVSKISRPNTVVGLGGWFPMIVRRGVSLQDSSDALGLKVTNGHCGTLASIYMMVERIAKVARLNLEDLTVAIIGVGKMGSNVAKALNEKVRKLVLIEVNEGSLKKVVEQLKSEGSKTVIESVLSKEDDRAAIRQALKQSHIGVCATSTFRNLLRLRDMPDGFIAIDDSRPEALPRDPKKEKIILEGGLLKVKGAMIDYDYGFGQDDNVFGCLGEAFLLALDGGRTLEPTVGEVEMDNFFRVLKFCKANDIREGDFKTSDASVSDSDIEFALRKRGFLSKELHKTLPV